MEIVLVNLKQPHYLGYVLDSYNQSNPALHKTLIGDETNAATARRFGWTHIDYRSLQSGRITAFEEVYKPIAGRAHNSTRGRLDWLRVVFLRFFLLQAYAESSGASTVWHADSDVMVLKPIWLFSDAMESLRVNWTIGEPGTGPNGVMSEQFLKDYCDSMIEMFLDSDFVAKQAREFVYNKEFALTEMRAFHRYVSASSQSIIELADLWPGKALTCDPIVTRSHGFDSLNRRLIGTKKLFTRDRSVFSMRNGEEAEFALINCTGAHLDVFNWIALARSGRVSISLETYAALTLAQRKSLQSELNLQVPTLGFGLRYGLRLRAREFAVGLGVDVRRIKT